MNYRTADLKCWVYQSKNIFSIAWLQAYNIINDVIHLFDTQLNLHYAVRTDDSGRWMRKNECTSFSQLEPMVSKAMGLLGALPLGPGGMLCSGGWFGHWPPAFPPRVEDRNCLTCCLWACWMWYFVGLSRWDWTCIHKAIVNLWFHFMAKLEMCRGVFFGFCSLLSLKTSQRFKSTGTCVETVFTLKTGYITDDYFKKCKHFNYILPTKASWKQS